MSTGKAMKMKILLPVDESPYSTAAVQTVMERPWPPGTTVRVISVVESAGDPAMFFDKFQEERTRAATQLTKGIANSLAECGLASESVVHVGDPRSVIVDEAEDWKVDLIILGSHGDTGIKKWLLGSVAQAVLSHAPCSVEVVRSRAMHSKHSVA